MAYQNGTTVTLSTQDTATLAAYITALKALPQPPIEGYTAAQVAQYLNTGQYIPNPQPQGTVQLPSLPKSTVLEYLTEFIVAAQESNATEAVTVLTEIQTGVQANPLDPIPATIILQQTTAIKAAGYDPTAQVTAALTAPAPGYATTVLQGPWALSCLSVPTVLTAADITAAVPGIV